MQQAFPYPIRRSHIEDILGQVEGNVSAQEEERPEAGRKFTIFTHKIKLV
jgi:hypothetical protein